MRVYVCVFVDSNNGDPCPMGFAGALRRLPCRASVTNATAAAPCGLYTIASVPCRLQILDIFETAFYFFMRSHWLTQAVLAT